MRAASPLAVLAALTLAAAAGCRRPAPADDGVRVTMTVAPQPPVIGTARVELSLADAAGAPIEAASVAITGNMAHPGMVPTHAEAKPAGPGAWRADLELTMGGDWFVEVDARLRDGRTIRRDLPLPGVAVR